MNWKTDVLALLRDPFTGDRLLFLSNRDEEDMLMNVVSGRIFPIRNGIAIFITDADVSGDTATCQRFYDRIALIYDVSSRFYAWVKSGGIGKRRREYLKELEITPNSNVLEVSVGTGLNWQLLPKTATYFGLDISYGMLMQCQRRVKKHDLVAYLFQGLAEQLPFADDCFDSILHMGGMNYFGDITRVIEEMIRVAKPGAKIVIVDETEDFTERYQKTAIARLLNSGRSKTFREAAELLPPNVLETRLRDIAHGDLYCLTFRKPS